MTAAPTTLDQGNAPAGEDATLSAIYSLLALTMRYPEAASCNEQLFDTLDLAMNAALQGFGLSLGDPTIVAEELESGVLVAPFAPVLSTDHEYALVARPNSQRQGVQRVCHWLLEGEGHP